jgi:hypothetical protein
MKTIPNYNGKIWEYIPEFSNEVFLRQCIERNNLTKSILMDKRQYEMLFNSIIHYKIGDPSHKNISINGICHFHYPQQQIIEI